MILLLACGGNASTAQKYSDAHRDDFAIEYHCMDLGEQSSAPEAVQKALERADAEAERQIAAKLAAKDEEGAYAATLARVDLWVSAKACGAPALALNAMWEKSAEQRARAMKATLAAWDKAQIDGSRTTKQQWTAIEHARQWQENDPDLTARASSLRQKLLRTVRVVGTCARCKPLVDAVTAAIVAKRSPLVSLSNEPQTSFTLLLDVDGVVDNIAWHEIEKGQRSEQVTKYNRFNEAEKNSEGKTITEKVSVSFWVDEEASSAKVKATATLRSEQDPGRPQSYSSEKKEQKRRWRWVGDERALPSGVKDPGDPVTPGETLLQRLLDDHATQIANNIVSTIEGL